MFRSDESKDGNGRDPFSLVNLPQNQIDEEWQRFSERHISPSRLFQLSLSMIEVTAEDRQHLEFCERCRAVFDEYRCSGDAVVEDRIESDEQASEVQQCKLDRGRVVLDILLLLEEWGTPVSITVLEPALVLMRNDAARRILVGQETTPKEKSRLQDDPHFITGIDIVYRGLMANGAIRLIGESGYELANPQVLAQVSNDDRSKAKDVVQAIKALNDMRMLREVVATITSERYEVIV